LRLEPIFEGLRAALRHGTYPQPRIVLLLPPPIVSGTACVTACPLVSSVQRLAQGKCSLVQALLTRAAGSA
jgi:hypothetical protein